MYFYRDKRLLAEPLTSFFGKAFFVLVSFFLALSFCRAASEGNLTPGEALFDSGDYAGAFDSLSRAAQAGNARSQYRLCLMYRHGYGVKVDRQQAFSQCRKAAFQDHMKAAYVLSDMYHRQETGQESEPDDRQEAYYWFRRAAELDVENGRLAVARMYFEGVLTDRDVKKALRWLEKAAEEGNVTALMMLGVLYEEGSHVEKDEARALALFAAAAEKEVDALIWREQARKSRAKARYRLGRMMEKGRGTAPNPDTARMWYKKAAEDGSQAASARLHFDQAKESGEPVPD